MSKRKLETLKINSLITELDADAQHEVRGGWGKGGRDRAYYNGFEVTPNVDISAVRGYARPMSNGGYITTLPTRL